jgi:hypothetical protein
MADGGERPVLRTEESDDMTLSRWRLQTAPSTPYVRAQGRSARASERCEFKQERGGKVAPPSFAYTFCCADRQAEPDPELHLTALRAASAPPSLHPPLAPLSLNRSSPLRHPACDASRPLQRAENPRHPPHDAQPRRRCSTSGSSRGSSLPRPLRLSRGEATNTRTGSRLGRVRDSKLATVKTVN